jgi:hypothetical protein
VADPEFADLLPTTWAELETRGCLTPMHSFGLRPMQLRRLAGWKHYGLRESWSPKPRLGDGLSR